jgi:putative acetyltransferase
MPDEKRGPKWESHAKTQRPKDDENVVGEEVAMAREPNKISKKTFRSRLVIGFRRMTSRISIQQEDPLGAVAAQLMRELSAEIALRYSDLGDDGSGSFSPSDALAPRSAFVVARLGGQPVGCGALRPMDSESAEIKRMFVAAKARRLGIGRRILVELERLAGECGYRVMRLETGNRQPEAIALYEGYGFCRIPPFGKYVGNPVSTCFEKSVVTNRDRAEP